MRKIVPMFVFLLACFIPMSAFAAAGTFEIEVPKEAGDITVKYTKIAEWEETGREEFVGTPQEDLEYEKQVEFKVGETVELADLEEGIYQIQIVGNEEYEFCTVVASIPMWNEETKEMEYDISIVPKYIRNIPEPTPNPEPEIQEKTSPQTGDVGNIVIYGIFGMFSLLIVIMSCHNRFKCVRMSE